MSQMIPEEGRYVTDQAYPAEVTEVLSQGQAEQINEAGMGLVLSGDGGNTVPGDLPVE